MIAVEENKTRMPRIVKITAVRYLAAHKLCIRFDDDHESIVNFGPFLKSSAHPSIRAYLDLKRFKSFTVEDGVLHWNDFDLVFPMVDLYNGNIS